MFFVSCDVSEHQNYTKQFIKKKLQTSKLIILFAKRSVSLKRTNFGSVPHLSNSQSSSWSTWSWFQLPAIIYCPPQRENHPVLENNCRELFLTNCHTFQEVLQTKIKIDFAIKSRRRILVIFFVIMTRRNS